MNSPGVRRGRSARTEVCAFARRRYYVRKSPPNTPPWPRTSVLPHKAFSVSSFTLTNVSYPNEKPVRKYAKTRHPSSNPKKKNRRERNKRPPIGFPAVCKSYTRSKTILGRVEGRRFNVTGNRNKAITLGHLVNLLPSECRSAIDRSRLRPDRLGPYGRSLLRYVGSNVRSIDR